MDSQVSDSQVMQVTYDDPEGRRAKAKLLEKIQRYTDTLCLERFSFIESRVILSFVGRFISLSILYRRFHCIYA